MVGVDISLLVDHLFISYDWDIYAISIHICVALVHL